MNYDSLKTPFKHSLAKPGKRSLVWSLLFASVFSVFAQTINVNPNNKHDKIESEINTKDFLFTDSIIEWVNMDSLFVEDVYRDSRFWNNVYSKIFNSPEREYIHVERISSSSFLLYGDEWLMYIDSLVFPSIKILKLVKDESVTVTPLQDRDDKCIYIKLEISHATGKRLLLWNPHDNTYLNDVLESDGPIEYIDWVYSDKSREYQFEFLIWKKIWVCDHSWKISYTLNLKKKPENLSYFQIRWDNLTIARDIYDQGTNSRSSYYDLYEFNQEDWKVNDMFLNSSLTMGEETQRNDKRIIKEWMDRKNQNVLTFIPAKLKDRPKKSFQCIVNWQFNFWYSEDSKTFYYFHKKNRHNKAIDDFSSYTLDQSRLWSIVKVSNTWLIIWTLWCAYYNQETQKIVYLSSDEWNSSEIVSDYNFNISDNQIIDRSSYTTLINNKLGLGVFNPITWDIKLYPEYKGNWEARNLNDSEKLLLINKENKVCIYDPFLNSISNIDIDIPIDCRFWHWFMTKYGSRALYFNCDGETTTFTWNGKTNLKTFKSKDFTGIKFPELWSSSHFVNDDWELFYIDTLRAVHTIGKLDTIPKNEYSGRRFKMWEKSWFNKFMLDWERVVVIDTLERISFSTFDIPQLEWEMIMSDDLRSRLHKLGITKFDRGWSLEFWEKMTKNREYLIQWDTTTLNQKPVVVVFGPRDDRNSAFMQDNNDFSHFTVLYFERVNGDDITSVNQLLFKLNINPAYIMIWGHGDGYSIAPSNKDRNVGCFDLSVCFELADKKLANGKKYLYWTIICFQSCSSGKNLVPCLSSVIPMAKEIVGANEPSYSDIHEEVVSWWVVIEIKVTEWDAIRMPWKEWVNGQEK